MGRASAYPIFRTPASICFSGPKDPAGLEPLRAVCPSAELIVPNLAYLRVRSFLQEDISYLVMWPYYVYLGVPVLGMIVGGLIAARRRTIRSQ